MSRDQFMADLKRRNIGTGLHFRAVHMQKYYRERPEFQKHRLPNTEWNSERICSLPLFPDMSDRDLNDVVDAIKEVLKQ
jgi:UDP-4-amino-4-deoxy-L-arabinose-oxoglutarate aminotransferase